MVDVNNFGDDDLARLAESDIRDSETLAESDAFEEMNANRLDDDDEHEDDDIEFSEEDEEFDDENDDGDSRSMELHENAQFEQADEWFGGPHSDDMGFYDEGY